MCLCVCVFIHLCSKRDTCLIAQTIAFSTASFLCCPAEVKGYRPSVRYTHTQINKHTFIILYKSSCGYFCFDLNHIRYIPTVWLLFMWYVTKISNLSEKTNAKNSHHLRIKKTHTNTQTYFKMFDIVLYLLIKPAAFDHRGIRVPLDGVGPFAKVVDFFERPRQLWNNC